MTTTQTPIDEAKLEQFVGSVVGDLGATLNTALIRIGDKLGLYKAMAGAGPLTAGRAGRAHRHRRALRARMARRPGRRRLRRLRRRQRHATSCPPEQAMALADEDSPAFVLGGFQIGERGARRQPKLAEAFRTGEGVGWHEHDHRLFDGIGALLPPGLPRQPGRGVDPGARRGRGEARARARRSPTSAAATAPRRSSWREAFPNSTFVGFDYHDASIEAARQRRRRSAGAGRPGHVRGRRRQGLPGHGYDLVCFFDCLHDMGDPVGRAAPRPRDARRRRHLDAGRAVRQRPRRGQPEPGRPRLLLRLDDCSARRARSPRRSGSRSARRPARRGWPRSRRRPASPASAARPRPRSTWCSRRGRSGALRMARGRAEPGSARPRGRGSPSRPTARSGG